MPKISGSSRWSRIIPLVFITYSLAYLDRANVGFGAAGGMATDLKIDAATYSLLGSIFFLGYFLFQIPGALYASRRSAKKLIFWSLILWGILAASTGLSRNVTFLIIIRFLLGVTESAVLPALLILLSRWFSRKERSRANTFLIFGNPVTVLWMSVLSGYLLNSMGWRAMFFWEGIPAVIWAFFWWKWIDDRPSEARWFHPDEASALQEILKKEQETIRPVRNFRAAFGSVLVITLCLIYLFWSIGVYGFVIWLPSMLKTAGNLGPVQTGWLSAFPYLLAIGAMAANSYISDKTMTRKIFVWPFLLAGAVAFYFSFLAGKDHFLLSFLLLGIAGMAMYAPYGPFFAWITELLPEKVSGPAIAMINSSGALGSFAGAFLVGYLNGHTGSFDSSFIFMSASLLLSGLLVLYIRSGRLTVTSAETAIPSLN